MSNFQVQIQIPRLPIALYAISDGSVALTPSQPFKTFVELSGASGRVYAIFDMEGFVIGGEEFNYNEKYFYKEIPELLKWLQAQNMEMPRFNN